MYSSKTEAQLSNLAHNVLVLRQKHGLTKNAMADILHISLRSLNMLEKGEVPPRLAVDSIFCMSNFFRIPVIDLFRQRL